MEQHQCMALTRLAGSVLLYGNAVHPPHLGATLRGEIRKLLTGEGVLHCRGNIKDVRRLGAWWSVRATVMVACMCVRGRRGATNLDLQRQGIERDDMNGFRMTSVVAVERCAATKWGMNTGLCYL